MSKLQDIRGEFRRDLSASVCALVLVVALGLVGSLFFAGELPGKLLCEAETSSGVQSFVYDFSSRTKTQLYVEGYSDICRVTGYHGDSFFCCARQGNADYVVKAENGRAVHSYLTQSLPQAMAAEGDSLYLLLGGEENGALVRMEPENGAQTVLQQGLFAPGGFCLTEGQFLFGKRQGPDVLWCVSNSDGESQILQADTGVRALALFGGYAYFYDVAAERVFRVNTEDGERSELTIVPRLAKAKDENAAPVFAFSNSADRSLFLLSNGATPIGFRTFLGKGRFLYPVVPFGLADKDAHFTAALWI